MSAGTLVMMLLAETSSVCRHGHLHAFAGQLSPEPCEKCIAASEAVVAAALEEMEIAMRMTRNTKAVDRVLEMSDEQMLALLGMSGNEYRGLGFSNPETLCSAVRTAARASARSRAATALLNLLAEKLSENP